MESRCFSIPDVPDFSSDDLILWDGKFMLEANEALGLDMPTSHDEVKIGDRQVFTKADEVLHSDRRAYDPKAKYRAEEVLSHTEARYGSLIVVMERSFEVPDHFGLHAFAWRTEIPLAQQFRIDVYDRKSERPDDSLLTDIVQDKFTTHIPLPFFMLRAVRLADRAEELAVKST